MGICVSKPPPEPNLSNHIEIQENPEPKNPENPAKKSREDGELAKKSPFFPFYSPSPAHFLFSKKSPARSPLNSSSNSTPKRFFKRPFPPPSPAKHIKAVWARRVKPNEAAIPEGEEVEGGGLDKSFGFSKNFASKYEVGEEVGRGHFGYTCKAKFKKGDSKGKDVAVKVIPKAKVSNFEFEF